MGKPRVDAGGGWAAIFYSFRKAREAGLFEFFRRLRRKNSCKTCALGMGGQRGGMVDEQGHFPEVCKKSIQAQAADMHPPLREAFFADHSVEQLASWTPLQLERAGRLAFPVAWRAGESHFRRVGWDEALSAVGEAIRTTPPEQSFFYASGRSSNEAAFLMQTFARAYGTGNINNCSYYCHQASGVALGRMIGSGTATVVLDDLDQTDFALVAGANPASNHPRLLVKLVDIRRRGGTVVVVNPLRELGLVRFRIPSRPSSLLFGSEVSDLYLQPHVGSDIAVFKAILKVLLESGGVEQRFLEDHVEGWEAVEADVRSARWPDLLGSCGLGLVEIEKVAAAIAGARRGVMLWGMGLTHHAHGVDNIAALANIALARGWLGRPGCGLLPIRGHSNVQGVGSVGFTPALKQAFAAKMKEAYGLAQSPAGLSTYDSMVAAAEGRIRTAVMLGGNLYGSNPDSVFAARALQRIETTTYISTKLNPGHVHGRGQHTLILPVLARDEERQATTQESMFNYVRLSEGGARAPAADVRSEVDVVCDLAARVLPEGPFPFERMRDHRSIREAIGAAVPGYEKLGRIDAERSEFQIRGRTFHEPRFNTPSGKAQAAVTSLPDRLPGTGEFRLMTLRSEGQFNTVVYEDIDPYRGTTRRDSVMLSAADASRLGVFEGTRVNVETETGRMAASVSICDLPAGNLAMYFPEANVLIPRRIDPDSRTPAFKSVAARIVVAKAPAGG